MSLDESVFINAIDYITELFKGESSGHDLYHSIRVHNNAAAIPRKEGGDLSIIRLAALLHDCDDRKLFHTVDNANARRFMNEHDIDQDTQEMICHIISQISFKGKDSVVPDSLEGKIVQDADRLDALGAIGIGRAFAYGGKAGRMMHIPDEKHKEDMSEDEYFSNEGTTINHFYEKLLLLKDMMNTPTAKQMAESRHKYMEGFLKEFYDEWGGSS